MRLVVDGHFTLRCTGPRLLQGSLLPAAPPYNAGMSLLGERELQRIARLVLGAVEADQAEVYVESGTSALTRFASNYVHQNVQETDVSVTVRAVLGKRIGIATSDSISDGALVELARRAV